MEEQAPHPADDHTPGQEPNSMRRRLGRGLHALLGGGDEDHPQHEQTHHFDAPGDAPRQTDRSEIHVDLIERNPFQPRKDFDDGALTELVESIRQHGILQPLLVRPHGDQYQLIAGERRWLAAKQAGLETVPCRVLELDDQRLCEAAIEENLKRKDLGVLEKAQAFQDYMNRFGSTIDDLAKQLSMNRSTVCNYIRLLELPDEIKRALASEEITNGHARALLTLDKDDQVALCQRIKAESLSVRKTEDAVREIQRARSEGEPTTLPFEPPSDRPANPHMTSHVLSLQDQLRDCLGAKVEIKLTKKEAGRIIVHFGSNDDFERILGHLRRAA